MNTTYELLQRLTDCVPPAVGKHHSLTIAEDIVGLVLGIYANGGWYKFTLDANDFDKDPDILVDEVLELFRQAVKDELAKPR